MSSNSKVILGEIKNFLGHNNWVISLLLYQEKGILVSSGRDGKIMFWNMNIENPKEYKPMAEVTVGDYIRDMIKMGQDDFLACGDFKEVQAFSLSKMKYLHRSFKDPSGEKINGMMKLDENRFIALDDRRIYILSYPEMKILKESRFHEDKTWTYFDWESSMVLSQTFNDCMFLSSTRRLQKSDVKRSYPITLYNFEEIKDIKEYSNKNGVNYFFNVYFDRKRNEEILICGGWADRITIYSSKTGQEILQFYGIGSYSTTSYLLRDRYLLVGYRKTFTIYDLEKTAGFYEGYRKNQHIPKIAPVVRKDLHKDYLRSIAVWSVNHIGDGLADIDVITTSQDLLNQMKLVTVKNLELTDIDLLSQSKEDEDERVSFMKENMDEYFASTGEKINYKIDISMNNVKLENILKVVLFL